MTDPDALRLAAKKRYSTYLGSLISGESVFPLELPFKAAKPGEAARRWAELRAELEALVAASSSSRPGASFTLRWETRTDRLAGTQTLPVGAYFDDESAFLTYLGKGAEARRFKRDADTLLSAFPSLAPWAAARPERIVTHAGDWPDIVSATRWFMDNPRSGLYLRQVPAVEDTKFIERHAAIIDELLRILRVEDIDTVEPDEDEKPAGRRLAERRFVERRGLRRPEPLVRLRILDSAIAERYLRGIRELGLPPSELERIAFPELESVIIIENKASFVNLETFLCIPDLHGALAIFGSGYAVTLAARPWLRRLKVVYWGDIDSHGLRILSRLRLALPATRSVMMDEATFKLFPDYISDAPLDSGAVPEALSPEEEALFRRLAPLSRGNRLEQERIPQGYASAAIAAALR